jgi:hypothetical protein
MCLFSGAAYFIVFKALIRSLPIDGLLSIFCQVSDKRSSQISLLIEILAIFV